MKNLFTILFFSFTVLNLYGQDEYKINHSTGKIIIEGVDEAFITTHTGNEVIFSINRDNHDEESHRAKGLRIVNSEGLVDNSNIGLSVTKKGDDLYVSQIGQCQCHDDKGYSIKIPSTLGVEFTHTTHNSEVLNITDVSQEIIVSVNYTDVTLNNVSGPMSIKTVYGDIEGQFNNVNQTNSISLNSVYGFVDITLPNDTKAELDLQTPYGEVYTDLDINIKKTSGMRELSSSNINGTINGGGVNMSIKSNYENVYLRKQ